MTISRSGRLATQRPLVRSGVPVLASNRSANVHIPAFLSIHRRARGGFAANARVRGRSCPHHHSQTWLGLKLTAKPMNAPSTAENPGATAPSLRIGARAGSSPTELDTGGALTALRRGVRRTIAPGAGSPPLDSTGLTGGASPSRRHPDASRA
jgi:hypothetical protein